MAGSRRSESNPFSDNAAIQDEREAIAESTLGVGRNATLTLGTDAVIVLGRSLSGRAPLGYLLTCTQTMGFVETRASTVLDYLKVSRCGCAVFPSLTLVRTESNSHRNDKYPLNTLL